MSSGDEIAEGEYPSDNYNVEDREADGNNVRLDQETLSGESQQATNNASSNKHQEWSSLKRDSATGRIFFVQDDGTISTSKEWNEDAGFFVTPQGGIYSFVDSQMKKYKQLKMKSKMELSEAQKILIGGLELLNLNKDNIIMVLLMLQSESQIIQMLEWLKQAFEEKRYPTQKQVMDMAQKIMQEQD